ATCPATAAPAGRPAGEGTAGGAGTMAPEPPSASPFAPVVPASVPGSVGGVEVVVPASVSGGVESAGVPGEVLLPPQATEMAANRTSARKAVRGNGGSSEGGTLRKPEPAAGYSIFVQRRRPKSLPKKPGCCCSATTAADGGRTEA